jgi:hypothetical protein
MKARLTIALMGVLCLSASSSLFADSLPEGPKLDKVSFSLAEKQWVETSNAKVTVNVNAVLSAEALSKARGKIVSQLVKIASGDWHITKFYRSQDSSGLEKLTVLAEARVESSELSALNQKAKSASTPGMTYKIQGIAFSPSFAEEQKAKEALRQKLYQKIQSEISLLNSAFKEQHYTISKVLFSTGELPAPMPQMKSYARNPASIMMMAEANTASSVRVSNELKMNAFVTLASNRAEKP